MRSKVIIRITVFLLLAVFICSHTLSVKAAGFGPVPELQKGIGSTVIVTLMYKDDDGKTVWISDANMTLYQVAELKIDRGMAQYVLSEEIKLDNIDFDTMSPEDSIEYASQLAAYVSQNKIKGETRRTDEQGKVVFTKKNPGIYLAVMEPKMDATRMVTYKMSPFLIMAPTLSWNKKGERVWEYQVTVLPKFAIHSESNACEEPSPSVLPSPGTYPIPNHKMPVSNSAFYTTPRTGDDTDATFWWCLLLGSIVGIVLLMHPISKRKRQ